MAKPSAMNVAPGGGGGIRARIVGGITGKGGKNVNPTYKDSGGHVKVIPSNKVSATSKVTEPDNMSTLQRNAFNNALKFSAKGRTDKGNPSYQDALRKSKIINK